MVVTPTTTRGPEGNRFALTIGRNYEVLEVSDDMFRLLCDEDHPYCPNEPVLYECECLSVVVGNKPESWSTEHWYDGCRYEGPSNWLRVGFWEDFFNGVQRVRDEFWNDLRELYPQTWEERRGSILTTD
jgi:hypothetical protein